jgi:hypothetical protein
METVCFSETLASTDESSWRQNPEEKHDHNSVQSGLNCFECGPFAEICVSGVGPLGCNSREYYHNNNIVTFCYVVLRVQLRWANRGTPSSIFMAKMDIKETYFDNVNRIGSFVIWGSHGGDDVDVSLLTPCKLVGRYQRFGRTYYLHFQGWDMLAVVSTSSNGTILRGQCYVLT